MLPCKWSMRCEKRFVTAKRRPSCAEGRLRVGSSAGVANGGEEVASFLDASLDSAEEGFEEEGGLGVSANRRTWLRILHCKQMELDGANGSALEIRVGLWPAEAIESKKSLGTILARGLMAGLFVGESSGWMAAGGIIWLELHRNSFTELDPDLFRVVSRRGGSPPGN